MQDISEQINKPSNVGLMNSVNFILSERYIPGFKRIKYEYEKSDEHNKQPNQHRIYCLYVAAIS